jgi:hypothetical protein
MATVPFQFVPMRFPWTTLPVVPAVLIAIPMFPFPEITLPEPAEVPPIVLLVEPLNIDTPCWELPRPTVPAAFRPM